MAASFKNIQQDFVDALFMADEIVPKGLVAPKGPSIQKRFSVYKNNVTKSLIEALRSNFPICNELVGEEFFSHLAREFIRQNPPKEPMLFKYGADFPLFISDFAAAQSVPYLSDVALLEDYWRTAYHAEDVAPISAEDLAAFPAEQHLNLVFKKHASVNIIKSGWPLYDLWLGSENKDMSQIDLDEAQNILICRPHVDVMIAHVSDDEMTFYRHIFAGETFGEAYEKTAGKYPSFDLNAAFVKMFQLGLLSHAEIKE